MSPISPVQLTTFTQFDPRGELDAGERRRQAHERGRSRFERVLQERELQQAVERREQRAEDWRAATLADAVRAHGGSPVSGGPDQQEAALARAIAAEGADAWDRVSLLQSALRISARSVMKEEPALGRLSAALAGSGLALAV
jgi:hypothetical protein